MKSYLFILLPFSAIPFHIGNKYIYREDGNKNYFIRMYGGIIRKTKMNHRRWTETEVGTVLDQSGFQANVIVVDSLSRAYSFVAKIEIEHFSDKTTRYCRILPTIIKVIKQNVSTNHTRTHTCMLIIIYLYKCIHRFYMS